MSTGCWAPGQALSICCLVLAREDQSGCNWYNIANLCLSAKIVHLKCFIEPFIQFAGHFIVFFYIMLWPFFLLVKRKQVIFAPSCLV
jgi:hypothetical protein